MTGYPGCTKGWIAAVIFTSLTACGDDTTAPVDTIAPNAIADLAITDSLGSSITLTWTASGDDTLTGTGSEYDLRHSLSPITEGNWGVAEQATGEPTPGVAGTAQEMTVFGLGWWERYHFALRLVDEAGNWSSISNLVAASPHFEEELRFLVQTRDGILAVDENATSESFIAGGRAVEVVGDRVYALNWGSSIEEYDADGSFMRGIAVPAAVSYTAFAALPDGRFAMMSNARDSVSFIDDAGNLLAAVGMQPSPDNSAQNLDGIVVGDALIISEDGTNRLLRVDLTTYEITVFRDLSDLTGWLGAIDYSDGFYYICQARRIYHFRESGAIERIAELPEDLYNISGVVVAGGFSFVSLNFAGAIYAVSNVTGRVIRFLEGLDDPEDLELIRP